MKHQLLVVTLLTSLGLCLSFEVIATDDAHHLDSSLARNKWIHGSENCETNTDPAIDVFRYDQTSYILRQNKCLNFEAPFIYVLFGDEKVLVLDTGATKSEVTFPLYKTVTTLAENQTGLGGSIPRKLLVIHSHSHNDHTAGDSQFESKPNVTVVMPKQEAVNEFFAFAKWPDGEAEIELGGRKLLVFHTPGHQEEAISVYDPQTKWLLTGDTFYPGYIYVKNWDVYKKSIARLVSFSDTHEVGMVLGAHIEMTSKAGEYYPIGAVFQPNEASLVLLPKHLRALNLELQKLSQPQTILLDDLIVAPLGKVQKIISNIVKWFVV